ncbi:DUF6340 family protein [Chitinophaga rhizophila]|uniref:Tetratricopeptide repeat protein n=1 Tax=Chitinophaga rhizophila TaxID=2866212 RepID=A0ABS7GD28_9BACT|nr:DUF6340 family protein [Chitinophaga rhizophila]MBW8685579.1 hypothetical protein [Chitinophaga rhizophila]
MKKLHAILLASITLYSCRSATNLVYISVQEPAPVTLASGIKKVGIINRSISTDKKKALDFVDKALTPEVENLEVLAAEASVIGLADELIKNNRFTDVIAFNSIDFASNTPGRFQQPLSWDIIARICQDKHVDALFSLELFDTNSRVTDAALTLTLGRKAGIQHQANMLATIKTGWRIYDPIDRVVVDEFPITKEVNFLVDGFNLVNSTGAKLNRRDAITSVSHQAGADYASRLVPYWIRVNRDYYVRGNKSFSIAKRMAQTGNWNGAAGLWEKETNARKSKIAGRACYNMAIICEINGQLDQAIQWAQKAYENYNNKLALRYINILRNRQETNKLVKYQQAD